MYVTHVRRACTPHTYHSINSPSWRTSCLSSVKRCLHYDACTVYMSAVHVWRRCARKVYTVAYVLQRTCSSYMYSRGLIITLATPSFSWLWLRTNCQNVMHTCWVNAGNVVTDKSMRANSPHCECIAWAGGQTIHSDCVRCTWHELWVADKTVCSRRLCWHPCERQRSACGSHKLTLSINYSWCWLEHTHAHTHAYTND